jgi:hypothetical protein
MILWRTSEYSSDFFSLKSLQTKKLKRILQTFLQTNYISPFNDRVSEKAGCEPFEIARNSTQNGHDGLWSQEQYIPHDS